MGLALFIIALTAASLISKEANRTVLVWASTGELAPGQIIAQSDLTPASVLLAQSAKNYLSSSAQIVGTTVLTKISSGDLIPMATIAKEVDAEKKHLITARHLRNVAKTTPAVPPSTPSEPPVDFSEIKSPKSNTKNPKLYPQL